MEKKELCFKDKLFRILCLNGAIDQSVLNTLNGSYSFKAKTISILKSNGLLIKDNDKMIRLNRIQDKYEAWRNYVPNDDYLDIAKKRKLASQNGDEQISYRLKKSGKALAFMYENNINVAIEYNESPKYYMPSGVCRIKNSVSDKSAAKFSRTSGIYYSDGVMYVVYSTVAHSFPIAKRNEIEFAKSTLINIDGIEDIQSVKTIVLMEEAPDYLKEFEKDPKDEDQFLKCDCPFEDLYVIPMTIEGTLTLSLLDVPDEKLNEALFGKTNIPTGTPTIVSHVDGTRYHCSFLKPNVSTLRKIKILKRHDNVHQYIIHSFPGYETGIKKMLPDIEVITHETNEVVGNLIS